MKSMTPVVSFNSLINGLGEAWGLLLPKFVCATEKGDTVRDLPVRFQNTRALAGQNNGLDRTM